MLEKYYRINEAAGISIHIDADGVYSISACSVALEGNRLEISKKIPEAPELERLKTVLAARIPVAVNLSGKGILTRKIDKTNEIDASNFNLILPNAKPDDFYIQNFISGDSSFVSVIRKADADRWIDALNTFGFVPLMLSLGPFPVQNIVSQLNVYGTDVVFNGHIILRDENGNWTNYRYDAAAKSPFALKVDIEGINEQLVIPYAAAFQLVLASKLDVIRADVPGLQAVLIQKITDGKLKARGFLVLTVLFLLLLINFVIFSWLGSSNTALARQAGMTAQSTTDIAALSKQIKQKDSLVRVLGWEGGIHQSALVDQVASLLPPELTWREVSINAVDLATTRIQKSLVFFSRQIRITGNSEKIIPVNEWIARLKTRAWVKNIQLDSYSYNSELNTGQFTITISY